MSLPTTEAKLLYVYFLTCEHNNSAGCYRLPDGYACADLGWTAETYKAERDRLVKVELIDFDQETSTVFIERWFRHCPPMNTKHAKGTQRIIENIECDRIREKAEDAFIAATETAEPDERPAHNPFPDRLTSTGFMNGRR